MNALPEESSDRRSQILDAAVRVIAERGVDGARLADIAEAAGVSLGLVQHYFRHRRRLLLEVFRREEERINETWGSVVDAGQPPLMRLTEYLWLSAPQGAGSAASPFDPGWGFWLEFWSYANRDDDVRAQVTEIYGTFAEPFVRAIQQGIDEGTFTPRSSAGDIAERLICQMDGSAIRTLIGGMEERRMLELLVDGLCNELGVDEAQRAAAHRHAFRR